MPDVHVKIPEDREKVNLIGVLYVSDRVIVVDKDNRKMKLFDQNGKYLSSIDLKDYTWGITYVRDSTFATCGIGDTIYLWTVRGQTIVSEEISYQVEHGAQGIHYNGSFYCALHQRDYTITILDRQGRKVRKIVMTEACGKEFEFGWDIHMDSDTNNIYVPCHHEHGVLSMTIEGQALWFTPISVPCCITDIQGTLCVADCSGTCLHLITKKGEYVRKLLDRKSLGGKPRNIFYGQNDKLYLCYDSVEGKHDMVSVYSVT